MILSYDIRVTGADNVARALSGIERRVAQHNSRMNREFGTTSTVAARQGRASSAASQADREARTAAAYWQRAHQRSTDFRIRADQKAHAERLRQIAREEATQRRATESLDRQRSRALLAQHKAEERAKVRQARINARDAKVAHAERMRFAGTAFGTVGSSVGNTLRAVGGLGATALSIGGSFAMAGAISTQMADSRRAAMLANQAGDPTIKHELLKEAQGVKGFAASEALGSVEQFVTKTGDLGAARTAMPMLSQLSLAYGADFQEMGAAAGQAFNVIRDEIKDPIKQMEALRDVMSTMAAQGTLGAVEIKDLTRELAGLGAATRSFEGGSVQLLKTMGAMAQAAVARGGAASAAEATTAVSRFAADIVKSPAQKEFAAMGVNVFSDKSRTKLKDPREIMASIMEKTGGDMTKIEKILNVESAKALRGFSPLYIEAEKANAALPKEQRKKKGEAGRAAMMAEFDKFMDASATQKNLNTRVASIMDEPAMKFQQVLKDFNTAAGTALLPALTKLIPKFQEMLPLVERAVEVFGKMLESFVDDPIGGIGKMIAAKLALDLASAGIGSSARAALELALSKIGGMGGIAGAADIAGGAGGAAGRTKGAKALGALKAAGAGLAIGTAVAAGIYTEGIASIEAGEASMKNSGQNLNAIRAAATGETPASEQEIANFRTMIMDQQEKVNALADGSLYEDFKGLFGASNQEVELKTQQKMLAEMEAKFALVQKAADAQMRAAAAQTEAANKLAASGPNRTNSPSPVTGQKGS